MRYASPVAVALVIAACSIERAESGRPPGPPTAVDSLERIEEDSIARGQVLAALHTYYRRFSERDWRTFHLSFWPNATLTTVRRPPGERSERVVVTTLGEFLRRTRDGPDRLAGFGEEMLHSHIETYGALASAWVLFQARFRVTPDSVAIYRGVDAFTLLRHNGQWRIVSLTWTRERPDRPLVGP